jgi:transcription elongation factor Elf1
VARVARRRKRRIKQVKRVRKPSRYFQCPRCGAMTLTVDFKKLDSADEKLAIARCGTCHLYCELRVPITLDKVDVYNKISDLAYENRLDECSRPASEEGSESEGEGNEEEE